MEKEKTIDIEQKPKRTSYEKGWWILGFAFLVCIIGVLLLPTSHKQVTMVLFLAGFIFSAILGIYSLVFFSKLPNLMAFLGIVQGSTFGFCFLGTLGLAWLCKK
jgi:hypothetical protein